MAASLRDRNHLSIIISLCMFLFLSLSYQNRTQASAQKAASVSAAQKAMRRAKARQREMIRATFSKGRWMLQMKNVPFDPDMLLRPRWRERLRPVFDQMPEMRAVRRVVGPLSGVYMADTLSLPEQVEASGDLLILAREVVFDGCSPTIRGKGNVYLFFIGPPKSQVPIGEVRRSLLRPASFGARPDTLPIGARGAYWSIAAGAWLMQCQGPVVDTSAGQGQEGQPGISPGPKDTKPGVGARGDDGTCIGDVNGQRGGDGDTGYLGDDGTEGGVGQKPPRAGAIMCDIPDGATGIWEFYAQGGKGGTGGLGGRGGKGGKGQKGGRGGDGVNCCLSRFVRGNGGPGGLGGEGGRGGNGKDGGPGGPGGDGNSIVVTYPATFNPAQITTRNNGGSPGDGGMPQGAGDGGDGGDPGDGGNVSPDSPNCNSATAGGSGGSHGGGDHGFNTGDRGPSGTVSGDNGNTPVLTQRSGGTDDDQDGYTVEDGDCDDTNPGIYPGAPISCQGITPETICPYPPNDINCNGTDDCTECLTPIILSFSGSLQLTSPDNGVTFDMRADGHPVRISWTAPGADDSFLAMDSSGNGAIDNGGELIGNRTPLGNGQYAHNGFEFLAWYDLPANGGNGNGTIDPGDSIYSRLKLWRDANHNGSSEPAELRTLSDAGVRAIEIEYQYSDREDRYGNLFRYRAKFSLAGEQESDTRQRFAWDVIFAIPEQ